MSCPEVVYQAYYPYLYQRPGPSAAAPSRHHPSPHHHHHPFYHHYDRVASSSSGRGGNSEDSGAETSSPVQGYTRQASLTPPSPPQAHIRSSSSGATAAGVYTDDDEDSSGGSSRAQYVSANCVVFTHYTGDVASVVDEHFTRALATDTKPPQAKDWSPMASRNFPPSFWNSNSSSSSTSSGGEGYQGSGEPAVYHCGAAPSEPWHSHYQQYHHHRAVHEYHQANMGYHAAGGLLLPAHQYKEPSWHSAGHRLHDPSGPHHHLDPYYPPISGLEPGAVQESSKDLYWF